MIQATALSGAPESNSQAMVGKSLECMMCEIPLPLRKARIGEIGLDWVCVTCESVYHAVLLENCPENYRDRVRPTAFRFDEAMLPPPSNDLTKAVLKLAQQDVKNNQRDSERRPFAAPVMVIELNDSLRPVGEPFMTMSRDLSASGISLLGPREVETKFVAIQLPRLGDKTIQVAMTVVRQRQLAGFFEIAGKFITRMHT